MKATVLTDSTSDLTVDQAEMLGIHLIPLNVQFDGHLWLDHQELGSAELFKRVQAGAAIPSTQPPSVEDYQAKLEQLLRLHNHVFAVHISSKLSQTYANALEAASAFPGRVTVVDSWNSSGALALQAERAIKLLNQRVPPETVQKVLETVRPQARTHMCLNTMSYLHKNGRIGGATALLGGVLNIKPIVGLKEGRVEAFGREMGAKRAMKRMNSLLRQYAQEVPNGRVAFFHNGNLEGVEELRAEARKLLLHTPFTLELGTVLSAHGGPGVFGFSFEPVIVWHEFQAY